MEEEDSDGHETEPEACTGDEDEERGTPEQTEVAEMDDEQDLIVDASNVLKVEIVATYVDRAFTEIKVVRNDYSVETQNMTPLV